VRAGYSPYKEKAVRDAWTPPTTGKLPYDVIAMALLTFDVVIDAYDNRAEVSNRHRLQARTHS
jgi:hypothetical protein